MIVPACVLEPSIKESCTGHIGVSRYRKVDVERTPRFFRVNLDRDTTDQCVWDTFAFKDLCNKAKRLFLRIPFWQSHGLTPQVIEAISCRQAVSCLG